MAVVAAFGVLPGTTGAGLCAYYRASDCDSMNIADTLPFLSKIDYYEDEYVIGEMLIWDTGEQSVDYNNCAMVNVMIYNDGWICAWFEESVKVQLTIGGASYVDKLTLGGWGSSLEYDDRFNGCLLEITGSNDGYGGSDPECPDGTQFPIDRTKYITGEVKVYLNDQKAEHFNTGYTYSATIYMANGNFLWWGNTVRSIALPPENSNRLYRAIYQIWKVIKYSSNSSNYVDGNASLVYMYDYDIDTYTNETTDFNDVGLDDCQVFPTNEDINDAFYIGNDNKFNGVSITMPTPGVGNGVTWEYWDGSAWSTLTTTDGTSGFTSSGELTFDPPDNWTENIVVVSNYYWIRARVTTAAYTTTPLLSQGQLYIQQDILYTDNELGLYDFEFTGANYCLLCGNTQAANDYNTLYDFYYDITLPGKVIYDHQVSTSMYGWSSSSYGIFTVNGVILHHNITSYYKATGYLIFSIIDIDYSPGIQNVFKLNSYGYAQYVQYSKAGTVLIVS